MKTKILRNIFNIFISVGMLFASARLLTAATSDGILDFGDTPLCHSHPTFITFDIPVPDARDISPNGINPAGMITGRYFDANLVGHGFLRARDGTITTFDPPGSTGTTVGGDSEPFAGPPINPAGVITGDYFDASGVDHGFLRARDGTITTFDAPGAVNGTSFVSCITPAGAVAGISFDANFVGHGFLRAPDGTFTSFDPPGSAPPFGTNPIGINPAGAITGWYSDMSVVFHGFLQAPDGTITNVDPPGSAATFTSVINPKGVITGSYFDASGATHGFLRIP
jgi:hypothetical protein